MPITIPSASELAKITNEVKDLIYKTSYESGALSAKKNLSMFVDDCIFHANRGRTEKTHRVSFPSTIRYNYGNLPNDYTDFPTDNPTYEKAYIATLTDFFAPLGYRIFVSERWEEQNYIVITISWRTI